MEKYNIPEENSLDSMEGLDLKNNDTESEKKSLPRNEVLKKTIIDSLEKEEAVSDEIMLEYFELYDDHARGISDRVCKYIESSGVSDIFDTNFWEIFFEAERKVLEEEQGKEVEVVEVVDLDEKLEIIFTRDKVGNMEEVYGTTDGTLIFNGIRGQSKPFAEVCDYRPRISKVLTHFLFNSLVSNGFVEDKERENFIKLFIPTTQAGPSFVKENNKEPYESISNETLKKQKQINSDNFFNKYTELEKEAILEHVRVWQWLCGAQRSASQDILRLGLDKFKEMLSDENEVYNLGSGYAFPWNSEYDFIVTEDMFLKGAEKMVDTIRNHRSQRAGDIMGHSLAYGSKLKEAIEMV